jgi:hypothetical protein
MKNLSHHAYLPCELLTSLLIRGIQMGEMSKLGWLISVFPVPAVTFNFQNHSFTPVHLMILFIGMLG